MFLKRSLFNFSVVADVDVHFIVFLELIKPTNMTRKGKFVFISSMFIIEEKFQ
jgi:hypothetical protein